MTGDESGTSRPSKPDVGAYGAFEEQVTVTGTVQFIWDAGDEA